jgi:hypothetical protein
MKKYNAIVTSILVVLLSFAIQSCSDDTSTPSTQVELFAELSSPAINAIMPGKSGNMKQSSGDVVDSMRVTKVRILITKLKLHRSSEDTVTGDKVVKTGPFLITIDSAGQRSVASSAIQDGTYDKAKFEIHRFSSSEISTYLNDPVYADFVTGDRYSTIIEGRVFKAGVATAFSFKSEATSNLSLSLATPLTITSGSVGSLVLQLQPALTFKSGSQVLDPRDPRNKNDIENGLKQAIKALKK